MMNRCAYSIVVVGVVLACSPVFAAKKSAAQLPDVAFIVNTGSTNTTGYRVDVFSDGSCGIENSFTRALLSKINQRHPGKVPYEAFEEGKIPRSLAQQFFQDIKAAMPLAQLPVRMTFKSVSFGTSTIVKYKGQQTPDLSSPADARGRALAADVKAITAALGVRNLPRRPSGTPIMHPGGPIAPVTPTTPNHE